MRIISTKLIFLQLSNEANRFALSILLYFRLVKCGNIGVTRSKHQITLSDSMKINKEYIETLAYTTYIIKRSDQATIRQLASPLQRKRGNNEHEIMQCSRVRVYASETNTDQKTSTQYTFIGSSAYCYYCSAGLKQQCKGTNK